MHRFTDRAVRDGEVPILRRALSLLPHLPQPDTHGGERVSISNVGAHAEHAQCVGGKKGRIMSYNWKNTAIANQDGRSKPGTDQHETALHAISPRYGSTGRGGSPEGNDFFFVTDLYTLHCEYKVDGSFIVSFISFVSEIKFSLIIINKSTTLQHTAAIHIIFKKPCRVTKVTWQIPSTNVDSKKHKLKVVRIDLSTDPSLFLYR